MNGLDPDTKNMTLMQKLFAPRRKHSRWFMYAQAIVPLGSAVLGILLTLKGIQEANKPKNKRDLEVRHNPHSQLVMEIERVFQEASEKRRTKIREQKRLEKEGKIPTNEKTSKSANVTPVAPAQAPSCH